MPHYKLLLHPWHLACSAALYCGSARVSNEHVNLNRVLFPYLLQSMAAVCHVQDAFRHSRGDESGQQQRMRDYLQFTQQLQHVAPIWRAGSGSTLRQVRHVL